MAPNEARDIGRDTVSPVNFPARGWWQILKRLWFRTFDDHLMVVAAGVAFFALWSLFPGIAFVLAISDYVLDTASVQAQIEEIAAILPPDAADILINRARDLAETDDTEAGLGAILTLGVALFVASAATRTLIEGLNIAYEESERRNFLRFNLEALLITIVLILGLLLTMALVIAAPLAIDRMGLAFNTERLIFLGRWVMLALLMSAGLAVVYRYGPSRAHARWRWITPGAVVATALWMLCTWGFSRYVQVFGRYDELYGALGGVVILMTWLWLSGFVILLGAELDAEMEHQTARDSTVGPERPMGRRGAMKADTLPPDA